MKKDTKSKLTGLAAGVILIVLVLQLTGTVNFMAGFQPTEPGDDDEPSLGEVYGTINTKTLLDKATADLTVNMYADAEGENFLDTVTTSSGAGTFSGMYEMGKHVWIQAREDAPSSATEYITPLQEWYFPESGEAGDTVTLKRVSDGSSIMWLRDVAANAPSLLLANSTGSDLSGGSTANLTSSDSYFKFELSISDADDFYGGHDFVDYDSASLDEYLGGIWLVVRSNVSDDTFDGYHTIISTPDYQYTIFHYDTYIYKETGSTTDREVFSTQVSLTSGTTFTSGQQWQVDVYDMVKLVNGAITSNGQFVNGGSIDVTAETVYVE